MSYLHDDVDDETPHRSAYNETARELTLSTGTILGIFFGLVLLCAVFFGFGYSMGSKTRSAPIVTTDTTSGTTNFNTFKPSAGSSASQPATTAPAKQSEEVVITPPATTSSTTPAEPAPIVRSTPAALSNTPAAVTPIRTPDAPESPTTHAAFPPDGTSSVVQVAAVSHQEDADLLINALKRKGYSVVARTEPQDKLFHIQVGPFTSKKDAEAMRQRLLADGYNAIVK